jgi:phosphatidylglycerol---prolipoprotein diacylglyceryl transferase
MLKREGYTDFEQIDESHFWRNMPNGFDIPIPFLNQPFHIYFYGILITLGIVAATLLAYAEAKRTGQNPEILFDMLIWIVIAGVIGARIWHILTPPPSMTAQGITTKYYLTHPLLMIDIRNGGLGIPGAVIGGILAMWIYTRRKKLALVTWLDIAAPGLALAQAIGRWGNFFNQELYGAPTNLPWKIYIDPLHRLPGFENIAYYHPLFIYESLWNLANMAVLLWLSRRFSDRLKPGDVFLGYLVIYPLGRFLLDFLRLDASRVAGINANQTLSAIVAVIAAGVLIWRHLPSHSKNLTNDHVPS